jgi:hypothetical protein
MAMSFEGAVDSEVAWIRACSRLRLPRKQILFADTVACNHSEGGYRGFRLRDGPTLRQYSPGQIERPRSTVQSPIHYFRTAYLTHQGTITPKDVTFASFQWNQGEMKVG